MTRIHLLAEVIMTICVKNIKKPVAPSAQGNLANTVMEALACGTSVVAFDIGGMPDLVKHGYNGYLTEVYDADDLANGIEYCCQKAQLRMNAREYVLRHFQYEQVAGKNY